MKLVSYSNKGHEQAALYIDGKLVNLQDADAQLPSTMMSMLADWPRLSEIA
jgi:hypothetical protein